MTRTIRVLHVDDNPALRDLTAELLERVDGNISVRSEADPTAVPGRVATEPIDCVVCDFEMPGTDGLEVCDRIRSEHPALPFFLFTSKQDEELVDRALEAGVTDYVQKESGIEHYKLLANRVRNAVAHHQVRERVAELESAQ
jgi:CheY-like chemotaxis protein